MSKTRQAVTHGASVDGCPMKTSGDGLSAAEVEQRRAKYGYNELPEKSVSPLVKFAGYFWGPIPWMIEIAVVLSAVRPLLPRRADLPARP